MYFNAFELLQYIDIQSQDKLTELLHTLISMIIFCTYKLRFIKYNSSIY